MNLGGLAVFGLMVVAAAVLWALMRTRKQATDWPLYTKPLLSEPEKVLYHRLVKALPEFTVLAQVQLSRFLVIKGTNGVQAIRNRIDRKSVDFLICHRDFSIRAAIELDDKSHERTRHKARDADKSAALAAAGVELIRYNVKQLPSEQDIKARFTADLPTIRAMR